MTYNKIQFGSQTLLDLTGDSVTPETLAKGTTAHDAKGNEIIGTAIGATLTAQETENGVKLTATDKNGTTTATVFNGDTGKSAYAYAKDGGFTGTEKEFAEKLAKETDENLKKSGYAADAKAVGDALTEQSAAIADKVTGTGIKAIVKLTQAEYDSMGSHDAETLYVIEG